MIEVGSHNWTFTRSELVQLYMTVTPPWDSWVKNLTPIYVPSPSPPLPPAASMLSSQKSLLLYDDETASSRVFPNVDEGRDA